jgi:RHS repeat-associated protein
VQAADGGVTTLAYSSAIATDGTTTLTDPRSNVTSWSYTWPAPAYGTKKYGYRLTSMTDPLGRLTSYAATHTDSQLITSITDFRNRLTTLNWDWAKGNLTGVTRPTTSGGTVTTTTTYEASCSHCTSVTDPLGRQATATVDPTTKNITQTRTPRTDLTSYGYDAATGDITSMTPPVGSPMYYQRDYYGNATQVSDGYVVRSSATYDSASRLLSSTDANGKVTEYTWDALDRLTQIKQTLAGQPVLTRFEYDANGNRTALVDPKDQRWEWSYDAMNRAIQDKNPLLQTRAYEWDKNSNLKKRTDRMGKVSEFLYGTGDRLQQETYRPSAGAPPQATVTYSYNATTKLLDSTTDSEYGTTTFTYDNLDRLTTKATPQGAITTTLDDLGRRTAMQAPGQGLVSYGFDNNDNIVSISQNSQTTTLEYDPLDRLVKRTLPNTVSTEWTYSDMGFLSVMASKKAGVPFDTRLYERDNTGTLGRETVNGAVTDYGYDDLYRLTAVVVGGVTQQSWTYDKVGNRLTQISGGVTTNYTYNNANRLLTVNGAAVTHDANGNLTAYGTDSYGWDVRGRLRTLTRSGASYAFGYNADGLRTSKTVNGTATSFLLDGDSVVSETTGGVAKYTLQSPVIDQPLARDGKWFVPDKVSSAALLTDGSGSTVQTYGYKPFGELTNSPTDSNPFQFTGRENDGTGLMYYRARYYAPQWGRFISEDPIGFEGGINQYVYCENNPLNDTDPTGQNIPDYQNFDLLGHPKTLRGWWIHLKRRTAEVADGFIAVTGAIVQSLRPGVSLSKETQQAIVDAKGYVDSGTKPSWAGKNWGTEFRNDPLKSTGQRPLPTTPGVKYTEYGVEPTAGMKAPGKFRLVEGGGRWWYSPDHWETFIEIIFK